MNEGGGAREYHRLTVHDPSGLRPSDQRLVRDYRPLQWERKPPQFKTYPGLDVTSLPDDLSSSASGRLDIGLLSRLLFLSAGVVREVDLGGGETMYFRAAGSAGNLFPLELYVVTGELSGLRAGVYHYQPVEHGLVRLREAPPDTPPALVLTGVPWRTAWKYRERGFRHLYWDAGTMLSQTLALAEHAGLTAQVQVGFDDRSVAGLLGADGIQEFPLVTVALTQPSWLPPALGESPIGHLATDPLEFPLITEAQRAGDLASHGDADTWHRAAAGLALERASTIAPLLSRPLEDTIRRRGSCRRFDSGRTAPGELLLDAMAWATRPVAGDFTADGTTLLEHNLAVHAVDGVEPGMYRWRSGNLEQLRGGLVRDMAIHLCLDQQLGGSGAYTAFHCARLDDVLGPLGSRGYRAAQLEAGIVEGRLHLFAYDHDWAATGLTFYDRQVSQSFDTEASPLLVTAVGAPAYRSRPGGLPRRPARMGRL